MANGEAEGILQAGQAIGQGLGTALQLRAQKQMQLQQLKLQQLKQNFQEAKDRLDIGFKLFEKAKTRDQQQRITNTFILPALKKAYPNVPPGTFTSLEDPEADAVSLMATAYDNRGMSGVNETLPILMDTVAQSTDVKQALESLTAARGLLAQPGQEQLERQKIGLEERRVGVQEAAEERARAQAGMELGLKERGVRVKEEALGLTTINRQRQLLQDFEKGVAENPLTRFIEKFSGGSKVRAQQMRKDLINTLQQQILPSEQAKSDIPNIATDQLKNLGVENTPDNQVVIQELVVTGAPITEANFEAAKQQLQSMGIIK